LGNQHLGCEVTSTAIQFHAKGGGANRFDLTPGGGGLWKDLQFVATAEDCGADWLVVYDDLVTTLHTRVPWERRVIFLGEPPTVKTYYPHFLNQFGVVVSPMRIKGYKGLWVQQHGALYWLFGPNFDATNAGNYDEKQHDLSIICSDARKYPVQRQRYAFVKALKEIMGDRLHWYGRGAMPMGAKADGIIPYRYSIAIENNFIEHFWTEKLADVFLGQAFAFYSGGPNIARYFSEKSFVYIDLQDVRGAAKKIEHAIENRVYEENLPHIKEARQKILLEYNLFNEAWKIVSRLEPTAGKIPRLAKAQALAARRSGVRSWILDQPRRAHRTLEWLEYRY
jgi:hypothetical protein